MRERDEIDEIMARGMRLRKVEANKILTDPVHIQRYIDTYWKEELPAVQAARAALRSAGYEIVATSNAITDGTGTQLTDDRPIADLDGVVRDGAVEFDWSDTEDSKPDLAGR